MFSPHFDAQRTRIRRLVGLGLACWALLLVLRGFNIYGENAPWVAGIDGGQPHVLLELHQVPALAARHFVLMTLGGGCLLLALFDRADNAATRMLSTFGGAPMFYYLLHLYVLLVGYHLLLAVFGPNQGTRFGAWLDQFWVIWLVTVLLVPLLYFPTRAFARYKRRTTREWVRYF